MKSLVCPISSEVIDSNVSRLTVFLNVILMGFFIFTLHPVLISIVTLDYFIRAFMHVKYSPLRFIAVFIVRLLGLKNKPIDLAPKIFASRLGFLCAGVSAILIFMDYSLASVVVIVLLMALSLMDSVLNFCVGCWVYAYLVVPFYKNR